LNKQSDEPQDLQMNFALLPNNHKVKVKQLALLQFNYNKCTSIFFLYPGALSSYEWLVLDLDISFCS